MSVGVLSLSAGLFGFGKKKEKEDDDPVLFFMKSAILAQSRQSFKDAEHLFHEALKAADIQLKKNEMSERIHLLTRTHIFDRMADLALSQGHFEKSEALFKETMKGCLQAGSAQTDNDVVEISIKLASIYAIQNRDAEARQGFEFCITTQKSKIDKNPESDEDTLGLLGLALESFGRYLLLHHNYDQAEKMFYQSIEMARKVLGNDHNQTLILLNDLATVYIFKKRYDIAEKTIKEAIEIGEKMESEELPVLYNNLGALYFRQNLLQKAKLSCEMALSQSKESQNMSCLHEAEKCLKKIESILNKK